MNRQEYNWEDIILPLIEKYLENEDVNTMVIEFTVDNFQNFSYYISREEYISLSKQNIIIETIKEHLAKCKNVALLRITTYAD